MGVGQSHERVLPTHDELYHLLTSRFAQKCYTPLELYSFNLVFKSLADVSSSTSADGTTSSIYYWSESTLCRFLELPDALSVGSVVFQMCSYLAAFPFAGGQAPAILTNEALLRVVTLLTGRYKKVLGGEKGRGLGRGRWWGEIYRSLAVYDWSLVTEEKSKETKSETESCRDSAGESTKTKEESAAERYRIFSVDAPEDEDGEEDEDDDMVLAALNSMDAIEAIKQGDESNVHHSMIPSDNFLRLLQLLLLIAPLDVQESLSTLAATLSEDRLEGVRNTANNILSSFGVDKHPGVTFKTFNTVVSTCLPNLFDGLQPLFEHFLFAKDFDLSKRKKSVGASSKPQSPVAAVPATPAPSSPKDRPARPPLLPEEGEIMDLNTVTQLSFFLSGDTVFRRLRPLYSGNDHGFSMGSFEKHVFNWRAPSIILISGSLMLDEPLNARERTFSDSLPPKRLPSSLDLVTSKNTKSQNRSQTLVYGAYVPVPWHQTQKTTFSDAQTILFQLSPFHDIFGTSTASTDYAYFNKPPTKPGGIGFGTPLPHQSPGLARRNSVFLSSDMLKLGDVSLHLDDALEFGVFTHFSSSSGSYESSRNPARRHKDWQDRFEIEALEVWGIGGEAEAEAQRREWAWEEREAEMRRRVNLGTGDIDADRELLKMAGLVGGGRSGGSV